MTQPSSTLASLVSEVVSTHREPAWLQSVREAAWTTYENTPVVPFEKSDIRKRNLDISTLTLHADSSPSEDAMKLIDGLKAADASYVVVRDGKVLEIAVSQAAQQAGVVLADLHKAASEHEAKVRPNLGSVVPVEENKWTALNAALWTGGVFVYIPKHVSLEEPLHVIQDDTGTGAGVLPRILLVADEGSKSQFVGVQVAAGEKSSGVVQSSVFEVIAKANANVTVVLANEFKQGPTRIVTNRALTENDAEVNWIFTDVGDGYTVGLVETKLKGNGSRATVKALGLGHGRQHLDVTASMVHSGRYSISDIVMHGVLKERANSVYRSSTHILRHAANAGSEQSDRLLVLDGTARADAIPMLLIDENDVQRCGHAASVGRIDESQIYYLMSRGIPESTAKRMIIWGHLMPTVEVIPTEAIREWVKAAVDRELA